MDGNKIKLILLILGGIFVTIITVASMRASYQGIVSEPDNAPPPMKDTIRGGSL
jgi:hypothetical protein